jgi:hypothetical protein
MKAAGPFSGLPRELRHNMRPIYSSWSGRDLLALLLAERDKLARFAQPPQFFHASNAFVLLAKIATRNLGKYNRFHAMDLSIRRVCDRLTFITKTAGFLAKARCSFRS